MMKSGCVEDDLHPRIREPGSARQPEAPLQVRTGQEYLYIRKTRTNCPFKLKN